MKINEKLRRLRIEAGLSQEAFGVICYSTQSYVKQYEKGWMKPDKFVVEEKGIVPRYFAEIIEKTKDLNKIPHHLVDTTAFGLLCRTYCVKQDPVILPAIRMLLDAGADIDAGGDWVKVYSGPDDKKYYEVGEKLKAYIALYVQQKENLKETQEAVTYEYEI